MIRRVCVLLALLAATASVSSPAQASGLYVSCYQTGSSRYYATYHCVTSEGYTSYSWSTSSSYGGYTFTTPQSEIDVSCSEGQYLQVRVTATSSAGTDSGATEHFGCNVGGDIEPI